MDDDTNDIPNPDDLDDRELGALFERAGHEGPPPDRAFLARLREESAAAFEAATNPIPLPGKGNSDRTSPMTYFAIRAFVAAAVAAVVAVGAFLMPDGAADRSTADLGEILNQVAAAHTLHVELKWNNVSATAWIRRPGQMRVDHSDGTYRIARGARVWHIDEKANRAASQPTNYFRPDGDVDLLELLEVPDSKGTDEALKKATLRRTENDGRAVDLYTAHIAGEDEQNTVRIECVVDARTRAVRALRSFTVRGERIEPIAEVNILAVDEAVDEELFVVGETLTEDGRIGKVTDAQGIVSVKPVMHRRFTPVTGRVLLKPGDWLRTDVRGANAVTARLVKETTLTLGPGTLVELPSPQLIKLVSGEVKIVATKKRPVELMGPDGKTVKAVGTAHYRVDRQTNQLVTVEKPPVWLAQFEGTTAKDSIGSLVVNVDGRNVPLTVGYHKVTVDVRDQIARTVIEESFVNRTDGRLEGVFYFPLPQDASISGFGMWIGSELVEADVVEKQRAREIYETILRERRDPGLLEWTGGNLFKARIFPIEPHSEKRVKITYTQVLPLKNGRYRYSYALQSEMLKLHPLRELAIDVRLSSAMPLAGVTCPTHLARIDKTDHSAHVEFTAQEYTPDRDFEVVVEANDRQQDVVVIPHRRGDDGYFMLLLTPPASKGKWQRETLPDGDPLELVILADTSGSIDAAARKVQAQLVASLLGSLTAEDRVNLATCDVECDWVFDESQPATVENVAQIRERLDRRVSLGWTDLDRAFKSAAARCGPNTQLVYLGDGVVNTTDADAVAFAHRLKRLFGEDGPTLHAVSVGSSFESIALNAIASLGGGSVRQVSGEQNPQRVAAELLGELTQPTFRDLAVSFRGLRTARVYPEKLPNLAAGKQQILLGRYLPDGADQSGEVTVTGVLAGKPVKFSTQVSLTDAESGNSFTPRLWARMHLDSLLAQGTSQSVKDEIIALSEEYHIITPYTSLLVLESDADRERFKVRRRFQMRDGQRFFAQGRERADFELMQKQMQLAGNWRLGLRRQVLRDLIGLGRDVQLFQRLASGYPLGKLGGGFAGGGGMGGGGMGGGGWIDGRVENRFNREVWDVDHLRSDLQAVFRSGDDASPAGDWFHRGDLEVLGQRLPDESEVDLIFDNGLDMDPSATMAPVSGQPMLNLLFRRIELESRSLNGSLDFDVANGRYGLSELARPVVFGRDLRWLGNGQASGRYIMGDSLGLYRRTHDVAWLASLFPALGATPEPPQLPKERWPEDARRLSESLLRTEQLAALGGGLQVEQTLESFDLRWDTLASRSESLVLVSPKAWLDRKGGGAAAKIVRWCDEQQRGVVSVDLGLGRVRNATPADLKHPPLELSGYELRSMELSYPQHRVELKPQGDSRTLVVLRHSTRSTNEIHILVDTQRNLVLRIEDRWNDRAMTTTRLGDFVQVAGAWWATRVEKFNAAGERTSVTAIKFSEFDESSFAARLKKELAPRTGAQLLREPLPKVADAKQALAEDKADFEDRMVLAIHFARIQNWKRVGEHLDAAADLTKDKPGMRWVRYALLKQSRRREELRIAMMAEAEGAAKPPAVSYYVGTYLVAQASGVFSAGEMLALLDALRPLYDRQPKHLFAMKSWRRRRLGYLGSTGQQDAALKLRRELAESYPHDYGLQRQYADALAGVGDFAAAYAWLDRTIVPGRRWQPHEEESLRGTYTNLLRREGRYEDLVEYLADWIAKNPTSANSYQQYLSALVMAEHEDQANELIAKWLDVEIHDERAQLEPVVAARLLAAVNQALGQGYDLKSERIEERWLAPLTALVEQLATHETQAHVADRVMNRGPFQRQDACRRLRREMAVRLMKQIDTLPVGRIHTLVNWIWTNDPMVEVCQWRAIAKGLKDRWQGEKDPNVRNQLAGPLIRILSGRLTADKHLAFLRQQLDEGPRQGRVSYANQLFDAVIGQPWTAELESEAFALLPRLSFSEQPFEQQAANRTSERLRAQVAALHRLTDRMVRARYKALMVKVEHQEKLTRTEQRQKRRANLKAAREAFAARLRRQMDAAPDALRPWLGAERLYLLVLLNQDLHGVAEECWTLLGSAPNKPVQPGEAADRVNEPPDVTAATLTRILRQRHLVILANLAARRDAKPQLVDRLLTYIDRGIERADDDKTMAAHWQMMKYRLLIALDRPQDLEASLREWIRPSDADNYWRRALGYLKAEQGHIKEAIALLEQIEKADELSPADYKVLAGWYMVADARDKHEWALIQAFKASADGRLSNWLSYQLSPWQRSDSAMPSELDQNVLRVFAALFEKSPAPQNYLGQLREFYKATREFRLLSSLADAVVGHTAGKVYPFLTSMHTVLGEVRDEATADSLVAQIAKVRQRAKTTVDRRALDLLELLVERRSSEVLNQPGPHVDRALAAMQRAFRREWSDGESRLMADLLFSLGRISQEPLAKEQIRELTVLLDRAERGSMARLHIAHALARTHWSYGRRDPAIDLLEATLAEYETAAGGVLPRHANEPLATLVSYLQSLGRYARGEQFLLEQLRHPANRQQKLWLTQQLVQLYDRAIANNGTVSLGSGAELYHGVTRRIDTELNTDDHNHRHNMVHQLCEVFRTSNRQKVDGVVADLRKFAFGRLPAVLGRQTTNYQSIVNRVADALHVLAGPRDALELLIDRIENEPHWFRLNDQDGWNRHSYQLARWRSEVGDKLGDLEPRLLAIVLAELRQDLLSQRSRSQQMYHTQRVHFWAEKSADFYRVAEEVYSKRKKSGTAVQYIAEYYWQGLKRRARAIEILLIAHRQKILDESGQSRLVVYLHRSERHKESIPILLPLVEQRPANLQYRVRLMHAYYRVGRQSDLFALLKATDEYFHDGGRWQENVIATLANSCLQNDQFDQAVAYYEEVINLHQRTQPGRGIGKGSLSSYYWELSRAYSGLKKTADAVDAACGAIVSWGRRHDQRTQAVHSLEQVLSEAPDLEEYVAELDKQADETGRHNPIVRKALGKVYFDQEQYRRASAQLRLAIDVQPNDTETHRKLVECYDRLGDRERAMAQLLESVRLSRREIELYKDLAQRYEAAEQSKQAERARTSIVEALPNESEGHAMLAEIRQQQDRWNDAIAHWRQVAEIRALEPTGLLKLAEAQIHQEQWDAANETCRQLRTRAWSSRFGDVERKIRDLERQANAGRKP